MNLLPVDEALRRVLVSIEQPVGVDDLPLRSCAGRTLAEDLVSLRDQPPFAASSMDGYAVRCADIAAIPATLRVIGTSAAGHGFGGRVEAGEAVRIFTGAPVPAGADAVVVQEDTEARDGQVVVKERPKTGQFVRPLGLDFRSGDRLLTSGRRLDARRLALAAAMGHGSLPVRRRPRVAILATGDELVRPGETAGADQIVASNPLAVAALVEKAGGEPIDLGIALDTFPSLEERIMAALDARTDLLVTLGGASVGDHDLVQSALARQGMSLVFWRVALRPGKPLMHGRLGSMQLIGLPGNPVSSIVCGILFLVPAVRALLGDPEAGADPTESAVLGAGLGANDGRQDYLRATLIDNGMVVNAATSPDREISLPIAVPHARQDSSMLSVLASSGALVVRPPHAPAAALGEPCRIIRLDRFC
jgi:molybdopterin molybdotransferase